MLLSQLNKKPLIGLAGGIGSGKSAVASLLAEAGAAVIDSDASSRDQLRDPQVIATLRGWWGDGILRPAGDLDRGEIARRVFASPAQRRRLEGLLHPRIEAHRARLMDEYREDDAVRFIVLDSPLLVEARLDRICDAVVFVEASDAVRLQRVRENRGWSEAEWIQREKTQNTLDKKRSRADHVVVNNSSDLDELRNTVLDLLNRLGFGSEDSS